MVTSKQLPFLIEITEELKQKECSITELQKKMKMSRTTLDYYLNILELKGYISKERNLSKKGRPVVLHFNRKKFESDSRELSRRFEEEEKNMIYNPLTFRILKFIKQNPSPNYLDLEKEFGSFRVPFSHIQFLISKGIIKMKYQITKQGEELV